MLPEKALKESRHTLKPNLKEALHLAHEYGKGFKLDLKHHVHFYRIQT